MDKDTQRNPMNKPNQTNQPRKKQDQSSVRAEISQGDLGL